MCFNFPRQQGSSYNKETFHVITFFHFVITKKFYIRTFISQIELTMAQNRLLHDLFSCNPNMVCKLCDKYLTVVPIQYVDDIGSVCGRCTLKAKEMSKEDTKFHRQFVLEALLQDHCFPCSNKKYGCKMVLKGDDDVIEHESGCAFKKEVCPLSYDFFDGIEEKCLWSGKTADFVQHVEASHKSLIKPNPFKLVLTNEGKSSVCFNRCDMQLVTIVLKYFKDNIYYFMVMLHGTDGDSQCYSINLQIFDKNEETFLCFRKNNLESLQHLTNCFESEFNGKMFKIDLNTVGIGVWRQLEDTVVLKFEIMKKSIQQLNNIKSSKTLLSVCESPLSSIDKNILKSLKCPECNSFMTGVIYKCGDNHKICGKCKVDNCQICETDMYTRDAYMEKISANTFLCANRKQGCVFRSNSISVDKHERVCKFRKIECVTLSEGCEWTGPLNLLSTHFQKNHHPIMFEPNIYYPYYLIKDCQLFKINSKLQNGNFYFHIFHYNYENTKYNFVIRLFDPCEPDICVTIPGSCESFYDHPNDSSKDEIVITSKMLEYLSSTELKQNIKIFKVDT